MNDGGGGGQSPSPRFAYTDKFYELFPYYLSIGMTYEQYWEQDCELVKYYRRAARIKRELKNQDAWLHGAYFYEALLDAAPALRAFAKKGTKPTPYRDKPYELYAQSDSSEKKEQAKEKQNSKAKAFMLAFMMSNNKKFENKGGVPDG